VVTHTHSEIIKKIRFLNEKDPHFVFLMLPILKPMKVYKHDVLYNQGDYAEEVFFILKGRIKMLANVSTNPDELINIPFNLYVEGSYFGDSDIFLSDERSARDSTALAEVES
jgi:CRP-like cAMP-binding protein